MKSPRIGLCRGACGAFIVPLLAASGLALAGPAGAAESAGPAGAPSPFFLTRGVVLVPGDLDWAEWPDRAKAAGLTTIALHDQASPKSVVRFVESEKGRRFLGKCRELGLEVEYELHAMRELLPRDLFEKEPALFRADESGRRTPDSNLCVHSPRALDVAARNALEIARTLRPTTHRYYFWGDDGCPWCRCRECSAFSESDQALLLENRLLEELRKEDPQALLAHLAYANTLPPPRKVKPRPGIFLEFAPIERRYDAPIEKGDDPKTREALSALDSNLAFFGAENAQALEYWLDASRFSRWRRPAVKVPFDPTVLREDLKAYGSRKIRRVTTFAVFIDSEYVSRHGEPPLAEYGKALLEHGAK